jgi:Gas vesicle synthesis protein GvpL/GvpF
VRGRPHPRAGRALSVYLYALLSGRPASGCGQGICAEPLRLVASGDLVALVGDVSALPEVTALMLRAQDAVLRRLAAEVDAVLPARFGTLLDDDAALAAALGQRRTRLVRALGRVAGCEQMTVRVWGDRPAPVPAAADGEPGTGPGTRYLTGRRSAHEAAHRVPELEPLRQRLGDLVRAERVERHDRPPLLATVQHLVARGAGARYVDVVDACRTGLRPCRVSVTGPWLPYAFSEDAA